MKADAGLIKYIKSRAEKAKKLQDEFKPHGKDAIKHVYCQGMYSAFMELMDILECIEEKEIDKYAPLVVSDDEHYQTSELEKAGKVISTLNLQLTETLRIVKRREQGDNE